MSTVTDFGVASPFVTEEVGSPESTSSPVSREILRLADTLHPVFARNRACCIVLLDFGGTATSSLWLAHTVGLALGRMLKTSLHILSTDSQELGEARSTVQPYSERPSAVETLRPSQNPDEGCGLLERLAELRAAQRRVLLHAGREDLLPEGLLQGSAVDHVVLLARAARTRRAALQATVQRMTLAGVPLLGCVLLDRTYPIPEKLYNLL